jgi:CRISPR/Cas system-associated endonuclease/helicase Cas3
MIDKDFKMLSEAYSKDYIKEEEEPSEYNSRHYDVVRSRHTHSNNERDYEFDHVLNGKPYHFIATVAYEIENDVENDDWIYHQFDVYKMAYEDPNTGEYVDIDPQTKTTLVDGGRTRELTLADVAKYHIEGDGIGDFIGL